MFCYKYGMDISTIAEYFEIIASIIIVVEGVCKLERYFKERSGKDEDIFS
jgi:hypothetical protein